LAVYNQDGAPSAGLRAGDLAQQHPQEMWMATATPMYLYQRQVTRTAMERELDAFICTEAPQWWG